MAFRRSAKASQIQREQSYDEAAPFLNDIIRGSTADRVRHNVEVPVLMIKAVKVHERV